ncbi:MAG: hypothetical protein ACRENL_08180 [Candidatus Dormibacteria bacterium]
MVVRFADDEVARGTTGEFDLDRADFDLTFDLPGERLQAAIIPLASVKRVLLRRELVTEAVPEDVLRKVALHFWDGEVVTGLLRRVPGRHRQGMTVELITSEADCAETYAVPYQALKAVFFLRTWDTRPPRAEEQRPRRRRPRPRQDAPLIDLLGEIRGLRGLRHRGQITAVEYERRRSQVLERI